MAMRETLMDKEYFEFAIDSRNKYINKLEEDIKTNNPKIPNWGVIYSELFYQQLDLVFLKYSVGSSIEECKNLTVETIKNYIISENHKDNEPDKFNDYIGVYEDGLRLTCLSILFNIDTLIIEDLKKTFDETKGKSDFLLDNLLKYRINIPKLSDKLIFPKFYSQLAEVFSSKNKEECVKKYLENWYKLMKSASWHNSHKKSSNGGVSSFLGYWAIEAAAVTYVLEIDDTSYKKMPYYPADLVDYARSSKK